MHCIAEFAKIIIVDYCVDLWCSWHCREGLLWIIFHRSRFWV